MLMCPVCKKIGTMVKHGYKYTYSSKADKSIRLWRIRCSKERNGCGYAPGLSLSETIPFYSFTASELWLFILALIKTTSINAAWNCAKIGTSVNTGYRIYKRLLLCQSRLRTNLTSRAPPPKAENAGILFQVFAHLKEVFGGQKTITEYQQYFQKSILSAA